MSSLPTAGYDARNPVGKVPARRPGTGPRKEYPGTPGRALRLDLGERPAQEIGVICQCAQVMARVGMLGDFHYRRAPYFELRATVLECPEGREFLASGWFPHYARGAVLRRLGQPRPPYALEVSLGLPSGGSIDLDVAALVEERLVGVRFGCPDLVRTLTELRVLAEAVVDLAPRLFLVLPRAEARDVALLASCYEVAVCDRRDLALLLKLVETPDRAVLPRPAKRYPSVF